MKNMTAKETALELALMILHSVIPSEKATKLMGILEGVAKHSLAKPAAAEAFDQANTLYKGFDPEKAQHIVMVFPTDQSKFCKFRDLLLAVHENISEHRYIATVEGWDSPREVKLLANQWLSFQLTVCKSDCSGCAGRVRDAMIASCQAGISVELVKANGGETWAQLPDLKAGNMNGYLERALGIKIVRLSKT